MPPSRVVSVAAGCRCSDGQTSVVRQWAEAKRHQRLRPRSFDFFRLAALASNARRYPPDISGSKLRMTPARPTTDDAKVFAKVFIVTSDRNDRSLIAKHLFRDPCRHDTNAKLAKSYWPPMIVILA